MEQALLWVHHCKSMDHHLHLAHTWQLGQEWTNLLHVSLRDISYLCCNWDAFPALSCFDQLSKCISNCSEVFSIILKAKLDLWSKELEFGLQELGLGKCLPFRLLKALFVDDSVESCLTRCRFKHQLFSIFGNYELENRLLAPLEAIICSWDILFSASQRNLIYTINLLWKNEFFSWRPIHALGGILPLQVKKTFNWCT